MGEAWTHAAWGQGTRPINRGSCCPLQADKQQQEADQANLLELVEQTRAVVDKAQVGHLQCMQ